MLTAGTLYTAFLTCSTQPGVGNEGEGWTKKEKKTLDCLCTGASHAVITANLPPTTLLPVYPGATGAHGDNGTKGTATQTRGLLTQSWTPRCSC